MIILGIDPGTIITGYGVIQNSAGRLQLLDYGVIRPPIKESLEKRYLGIYNGIEELIKKYAPHFVSIETQFVHKNIQSAIKLGMARGVAMVAAAKHGVDIAHYAPKEAKAAVTGNGSSSKEQVQYMIGQLFCLKKESFPPDAADALALAVCHALRPVCLNL